LIGTGLFSGYAPVAPGTAGSLLCCILVWFLPEMNPLFKIPLFILLFFVGVKVSSDLEKEWGEDPSKVVIDEWAGMYFTLIFIPKNIIFFITGFLLFRFFDIFKPFPVRLGERLKTGWGIMVDDVLAGIYAALILQIVSLLFNKQ